LQLNKPKETVAIVTAHSTSTLSTELHVNKRPTMNLLFAILSLCLLVAGSQSSSTLTTPLANEEDNLAGQLAERLVKPASKQYIVFSVDANGYLYADQYIKITRYVFKGAPRRSLNFNPPLSMNVLVNVGDVLFEAIVNATPITFRAPYKTRITMLLVKAGSAVDANESILCFDVNFTRDVLASGKP
jgi:hypothetical protein